MDQSLSQLLPIQKIGDDGFYWWIGQVEATTKDYPEDKGGYRFKVRIIGHHTQDATVLPHQQLEWAHVMMPVTTPFMPGNRGGASPAIEKGCKVIGFFLDGNKKKPIIIGSVGHTPGATTVVNNERPDNKPFTTAISSQVNPATDGQPAPENPEGGEGPANTSTGGLPDGTRNSKGDRVPTIPRTIAPTKKGNPASEEWCQEVADKCGGKDFKASATIILSEFLFEIQNNNGNIGTYLVNQATGKLYSGIATGRRYVNKMMRLVREFVANIKGFIIQKIKAGVKDLIHALLYPSDKGNILTPVTKWFNDLLKQVGCTMADLGKRLEEWLTNLLFSYIDQIYRAVICQVDALVNAILSKINELIEQLLNSVLGPLQDILGAIASPLDMIGGAINRVLTLLGITCSGPNLDCAKYKRICTDGSKDKKKDDKDFLDDLLNELDNLFPATSPDYTQYTCAEAYEGNPLSLTTVGFTGGIPTEGGSGTDPEKPKIVYNVPDYTVTEGESVTVVVTRSGYTQEASSLRYKTLQKGSASEGFDYIAVDGILGFAPNETEKSIEVQTLFDIEKELAEDFYVSFKKNTPTDGTKIPTKFIKNLAKITIVEKDLKEPSNPYTPSPTDPFTGIDDVFPPDETDVPDDGGDGGDGDGDGTTGATYSVLPDKYFVTEGDFVTYTIETTNIENGSILYYTLSGDITNEDIVGNKLTGNFVIENDTATVVIGIEDDAEIEEQELLTFTVNGTSASATVTVIDSKDSDIGDYDLGEGDSLDTVYQEFQDPIAGTPITDDNGGIIEIPIDNPGSPYKEPPFVFVGGEGFGATATALLDDNGYVTEVRIKSPGFGYKKNLASDGDKRCIIDTFTVVRPGSGYTSMPDIYINGELGVAEAVINDDGFVIGARILNRQLTFEKFPKIEVIGGGGYGAKLLPSLVCLDTNALTEVGATKIGTGRYVDCP